MPYQYEASHYHSPHTFEFEALDEAIRSAAIDLEFGEAWPVKITAPDGRILWEQSGPLTTSDTLKNLAYQHGVQWPDV